MPEEATNVPTLTVILGAGAVPWQARTAPELEPLKTEYGQVVTHLHHLKISDETTELLSFTTRFSGVAFIEGKVAEVKTNPQENYLELAKAVEVVMDQIQKLTAAGFHNELGEVSQVTPGEVAQTKTQVYRGSQGKLRCIMVLEKAVLKDSDKGRLAKVREDLYLVQLTMTLIPLYGIPAGS